MPLIITQAKLFTPGCELKTYILGKSDLYSSFTATHDYNCFNPLNHHDASKHHFVFLNNYLIS